MDLGGWINNLVSWLNASASSGTAATPVEDLVRGFTLLIAQITDAVSALIVAIAVVRGLLAFAGAILGLLRARPPGDMPADGGVPKEEIRLALGRSLALALEFEVGADILRSAVTPTWNDIFQLAAIILLRTVLNYFLQRELDAAAKRAAGMLATESVRAQTGADGRPLVPTAAHPLAAAAAPTPPDHPA